MVEQDSPERSVKENMYNSGGAGLTREISKGEHVHSLVVKGKVMLLAGTELR